MPAPAQVLQSGGRRDTEKMLPIFGTFSIVKSWCSPRARTRFLASIRPPEPLERSLVRVDGASHADAARLSRALWSSAFRVRGRGKPRADAARRNRAVWLDVRLVWEERFELRVVWLSFIAAHRHMCRSYATDH